jgi:hypothetical protein
MANPLAVSFTLSSQCLVENIGIDTYDTLDGSAGLIHQISYSIFGPGVTPTGTPLASGYGTILNSSILSGHSSAGGVGSDGQFHPGLQTIATSFDLTAPVDLMAGVHYWLVLSAVTDPFGSSAVAQWADSDLPSGFYLDNGSQIAGGRAFDLNGEVVAVPESANTLCLLVLGLIFISGRSRCPASS